MKKILLGIYLAAVIACLTACSSGITKEAIEQSELSMAAADYNAALNYLQLAQKKGGDSAEVREMVSILENYIKAKEEFDKVNMDGATEALNAIPSSYTEYSIASDIDKLKKDVSDKRSVMGDVDTQIKAVKDWLASGDYVSAEANITELYSKNLTNYQRKQVDELKQTLDTAQDKIITAENKKPSVVYVTPAPAPPATSTNINVVDTYYVVNCKEYITLRDTPSTKGADLAHIPLGESVGYIENAGNGFYKVKYNGKYGYALASYLSSEERGAPMTATVVNCNEYITLRATPSTSGADLAHIPLGAVTQFVSTAENGFYYIYYNGQYGYALQSYLKVE